MCFPPLLSILVEFQDLCPDLEFPLVCIAVPDFLIIYTLNLHSVADFLSAVSSATDLLPLRRSLLHSLSLLFLPEPYSLGPYFLLVFKYFATGALLLFP